MTKVLNKLLYSMLAASAMLSFSADADAMMHAQTHRRHWGQNFKRQPLKSIKSKTPLRSRRRSRTSTARKRTHAKSQWNLVKLNRSHAKTSIADNAPVATAAQTESAPVVRLITTQPKTRQQRRLLHDPKTNNWRALTWHDGAMIFTWTRKNGVPYVLLGERNDRDYDGKIHGDNHHKWCTPGGSYSYSEYGPDGKPDNNDLTRTAIREAWEETGNLIAYTETDLSNCFVHDRASRRHGNIFREIVPGPLNDMVDASKIHYKEYFRHLWVPVSEFLAAIDNNWMIDGREIAFRRGYMRGTHLRDAIEAAIREE
ncbi:hypothetical protein FACS189472_03670 [Alphaproteobacteria bacterium]|nr:hypothetical protein FACS189472_03670 [Alphaproteobacteria bacterium]